MPDPMPAVQTVTDYKPIIISLIALFSNIGLLTVGKQWIKKIVITTNGSNGSSSVKNTTFKMNIDNLEKDVGEIKTSLEKIGTNVEDLTKNCISCRGKVEGRLDLISQANTYLEKKQDHTENRIDNYFNPNKPKPNDL